MRALRFRIRRRHGRRLRERSQIAVSYDVDDQSVLGAAEAHAPRDRRGSPSRQRRHDIRPRTATGERTLSPSLSMPDVRAVRLGAVDRWRLRRRVRTEVSRHVLMYRWWVPDHLAWIPMWW